MSFHPPKNNTYDLIAFFSITWSLMWKHIQTIVFMKLSNGVHMIPDEGIQFWNQNIKVMSAIKVLQNT